MRVGGEGGEEPLECGSPLQLLGGLFVREGLVGLFPCLSFPLPLSQQVLSLIATGTRGGYRGVLPAESIPLPTPRLAIPPTLMSESSAASHFAASRCSCTLSRCRGEEITSRARAALLKQRFTWRLQSGCTWEADIVGGDS